MVHCGDTVELTSPYLQLGVSPITKSGTSTMVSGSVIVDGQFDQVKVSAPLERISLSKVKLTKKSREVMEQIRRDKYETHVTQLRESFCYRLDVRQSQIKTILKKEVSSALQSRTSKRKLVIGLACLKLDEEVLALERGKRRMTFNIKNSSLHVLDRLMGPKWDVHEKDGHLRFGKMDIWIS